MSKEFLVRAYKEFVYQYSTCRHIKDMVNSTLYKNTEMAMFTDLTRKRFNINEAKSIIYSKVPDKDTICKFIAYASRFYDCSNIDDLKRLIKALADVILEDDELLVIFNYRNGLKNIKRDILKIET